MREFFSSNMLWHMHENVGPDGYVRISHADIAAEFRIDESVVDKQMRMLLESEFIREVEKETYVLTEYGQGECMFLSYFVKRGSKRKVNPRAAVKIASMLREMYPGIPPEHIIREFAQIHADSLGKKLKCTEDEFELAKKLLQD